MKNLLMALFFMMFSGLQAADPPAVPELFPSLSAEDLKDNKVVLPKDCEGRPALVIVAFSRPGEGELESWLKPFHDIYKDDKRAAYYSVAMLEGVPGFVIYFIKNGMRGAAPESEYGNILISYDNREESKKKLAVTDDSLHNVFLLDRQGRIVKTYRSKKAAEGEIKEMLEIFKKLLPEKK